MVLFPQPSDPEPRDDRRVHLGSGGQPLLRQLPGHHRRRLSRLPDRRHHPHRHLLHRLRPHPLRVRRRI